MPKGTEFKYHDVEAKPVKSFFVDMLTRDIDLTDAILDLLDNCVDGVLRSLNPKSAKAKSPSPYSGKYAKIKFNATSFEIEDNCGGIPWDKCDYAFRMGRPKGIKEEGYKTVGTYGIGMKRAIFKLGRQCLITTQNGNHRYKIDISNAWIDDEDSWQLPAKGLRTSRKEDGTTIVVNELHAGFPPNSVNTARHFPKS
jgi:hypothetical protein